MFVNHPLASPGSPKIGCNILHNFETLFIVFSPNKQSPGTLALIYGLQAVIFLISSPRFWEGKRTFIYPCACRSSDQVLSGPDLEVRDPAQYLLPGLALPGIGIQNDP